MGSPHEHFFHRKKHENSSVSAPSEIKFLNRHLGLYIVPFSQELTEQ